MPKINKPHKCSVKNISNSLTFLSPSNGNEYTQSLSSLMENYSNEKHNIFNEQNYIVPKNYVNDLEECDLSLAKGKQIIEEIITSILDEKTGKINKPSSDCENVNTIEECIAQDTNTLGPVDKRLEQWQKTLKERRRIARHMKKKLGRQPEDLLFNRMVSSEERNKDTVKRLIDYAERMNPTHLMTKKRVVLPEYRNCYTNKHLHELRETVPKSEREKIKNFELCGIPSALQNEIMGKTKNDITAKTERKSQWLQSKILEQRIHEKREDIQRVIEFFPDFDNLLVIGHGISTQSNFDYLERPSDIELICEEKIEEISSDTIEN